MTSNSNWPESEKLRCLEHLRVCTFKALAKSYLSKDAESVAFRKELITKLKAEYNATKEEEMMAKVRMFPDTDDPFIGRVFISVCYASKNHTPIYRFLRTFEEWDDAWPDMFNALPRDADVVSFQCVCIPVPPVHVSKIDEYYRTLSVASNATSNKILDQIRSWSYAQTMHPWKLHETCSEHHEFSM
jgi:hypothetical protein